MWLKTKDNIATIEDLTQNDRQHKLFNMTEKLDLKKSIVPETIHQNRDIRKWHFIESRNNRLKNN